jgi:L-ascorbate metabolism protein UlaG (beta-lactamase superfamily)
MPRIPRSDHFDGNRFFNPTLPKGFAVSHRSALRMAREPRSRWPAWVENKGVHRLNETRTVDEVAITFVNHATFLIQTGGITILTDPVWSERTSPLRRIGPKRVRRPGVAFEELPRVDIILLSHNHYDHLDIAALTQLRQSFDPTVLAAAGDARLVGPLGFKDMRELDWWDEIEFNETLKVTFVPAQHFSARGLLDRQRSLWGGYMIESRGRRVYFGGDTGYSVESECDAVAVG